MPKQNNSENNGKLPTNIENATRGHIAQNLAQWQANIVSARAARLGVSVEEASHVEGKPLFVLEAEKRAHSEGRDVNAILKEYSDRIQHSIYPTAECLMPDEVAEYVASVLPSQRHQHISECNECSMLVAAVQPEPRKAAAMEEEGELAAVAALEEEDDFLRAPKPAPVYAAASGAMPASRRKEDRMGSRFRPVKGTAGRWGLLALATAAVILFCYLSAKLTNVGTNLPIESSSKMVWLAASGLLLYLYFNKQVNFGNVPGIAAASLMLDKIGGYFGAVPPNRPTHIERSTNSYNQTLAPAVGADIGGLLAPSELAYVAASLAKPTKQRREDRVAAHARLFFWAKLRKWSQVAAPVLVILLADYLYLKLKPSGANRPLGHYGEIGFLAACGLFLYLVSLVGFRALPRYRGLANGMIVGAIILGYVNIDARENRRIAESAFQWNGAASLGMASIQQLQSTGVFLGPQHASIAGHSLTGDPGSVNIDVKTSASEATYVVTASELPGQITVDVHGESGSLKWEDDDKTIKKADLLTGWVELAQSGDAAGAEPTKELVVGPQRFKCAVCALLPASGTRIVATVNPATERVENYLVIPQKSVMKVPQRMTEKQ